MAKEKRYTVAKNLIEIGGIKTISDLLEVMDKKAIYQDIPASPIRFNALLADPSQFRFSDAYAIAAAIGVEEKLIIDLIHAEYLSRKRKRK
jgi:hypothetical protein